MSKKDELKILSRQTSADAPIRVRGRTGDVSNVGSMIDLYAHAESPEEIILGRDDRKARERFQKGFKLYLKKFFSDQERKFFSDIVSGAVKLYTARGTLRVAYIAPLQEMQRKAYEHAEPLLKLSYISGWSGAKDFLETIFNRLQLLRKGMTIEEALMQYQRDEEMRRELNEKSKKWNATWRNKNSKKAKECRDAWRARNKEHVREYNRKYREEHKKQFAKNQKAYAERNKERMSEYNRKYRERQKTNKLRKDLEEAFESLSASLAGWIEAGKPWDGVLFTEFETTVQAVDKRFAQWYQYQEQIEEEVKK